MGSFREALAHVLASYVSATSEPLAGHPLAQLIRHDWPATLRPHVDPMWYVVRASPGRGLHWAQVPWLGIFDRTLTTSAQRGYYVVYLIRADGSGAHLSLVHGVEALQRRRTDAPAILQQRAAQLRDQLGVAAKSWDAGPVDLHLHTRSRLAAGYEVSVIVNRPYATADLPGEDVLLGDLRRMLDLYQHLRTIVT